MRRGVHCSPPALAHLKPELKPCQSSSPSSSQSIRTYVYILLFMPCSLAASYCVYYFRITLWAWSSALCLYHHHLRRPEAGGGGACHPGNYAGHQGRDRGGRLLPITRLVLAIFLRGDSSNPLPDNGGKSSLSQTINKQWNSRHFNPLEKPCEKLFSAGW